MATLKLLFNNNAASTLASPITAIATSVTVEPGDGAKFPNPTVGQQAFYMTFIDAATDSVYEVVLVTARSGDTMTILRGQDGTVAASWLSGDAAKQLPNAATMQNFSQIIDSQTGGTNFSPNDTGSANNYVFALSPAVTTRIAGLTLRLVPAHPNTGPTTINIGAGSITTTNPDGSSLGAGAIIGGGAIEIVDLGSGPYQLISSSQEAQSSNGVATTGDVKWRPTQESISGWTGNISGGGAWVIGNASSNGSYTNANAINLFTWVWTNFSNTQCTVRTSSGVPTTRGVSAAADFAANMQIVIPDMRGLVPGGVDVATSVYWASVPVTIGGSTTPGSILGENLHTLITAELAAHTHANTLGDTGHTHNFNAIIGGGGTVIDVGGGALAGQTTGTTASAFTGITISNVSVGSGTAHNTVQRTMLGTFYFKL